MRHDRLNTSPGNCLCRDDSRLFLLLSTTLKCAHSPRGRLKSRTIWTRQTRRPGVGPGAATRRPVQLRSVHPICRNYPAAYERGGPDRSWHDSDRPDRHRHRSPGGNISPCSCCRVPPNLPRIRPGEGSSGGGGFLQVSHNFLLRLPAACIGYPGPLYDKPKKVRTP